MVEHCLLVLFQQPFHLIMINNDLKEHIKSICINKTTEVCGFIVFDGNKEFFLELENKHPRSDNFFLISPIDYLSVKNKFTIKYLFHNHNNSDSFSESDIHYQKFHCLDMLIYNVNTDNWSEMKCK